MPRTWFTVCPPSRHTRDLQSSGGTKSRIRLEDGSRWYPTKIGMVCGMGCPPVREGDWNKLDISPYHKPFIRWATRWYSGSPLTNWILNPKLRLLSVSMIDTTFLWQNTVPYDIDTQYTYTTFSSYCTCGVSPINGVGRINIEIWNWIDYLNWHFSKRDIIFCFVSTTCTNNILTIIISVSFIERVMWCGVGGFTLFSMFVGLYYVQYCIVWYGSSVVRYKRATKKMCSLVVRFLYYGIICWCCWCIVSRKNQQHIRIVTSGTMNWIE